jgi:imidazolonepropionase-like amidohydrolase
MEWSLRGARAEIIAARQALMRRLEPIETQEPKMPALALFVRPPFHRACAALEGLWWDAPDVQKEILQMRKGPSILATLLGLAILSAHLGSTAVAQTGNASGLVALVGGTIYPSATDDAIRDGVVLIEHGKIAAVGRKTDVRISRNTQIIDCAGLTITAGFWNSHVHFFERKWTNVAAIPQPEVSRQLEEMLTRYGFTSVFDIGSPGDNTRRLRDRIESLEVPGPRIRSTGEVLLAAGAAPPDTVIRALGYMTVRNSEVTDAAQATGASQKLLESGADGIKVHLQPPAPPYVPFPPGAIHAAVKEAHRAAKPVFVHPHSGADVIAAIHAGVDVIAHTTPTSGAWDEAIITAMKKRPVALTPTLTVWKELLRHDRISTQEQSVVTAIGQLRAWVANGGTVLFGNDLGAVDYDPGEEYTLMAEAGMSYRQILASLTTAPAERFGAVRQLGRIASGFDADITVLRRDPSKDIRALATVQYTLRDGRLIYSAPR